MKVIDGNISSPLGFAADGLYAGFKKKKLDFGWIVSEVPASAAGVYTTNKVIAAPLIVTRESVKKSVQQHGSGKHISRRQGGREIGKHGVGKLVARKEKRRV